MHLQVLVNTLLLLQTSQDPHERTSLTVTECSNEHADIPAPEHSAHELLINMHNSPFGGMMFMLVMQAGDEEDTSSECGSSDEAGSVEAGGRVAAAGEGLGGRVRVRVGNGSSAGSDAGSRRAGSIASTYWRPERTDRKEALSAIDEQCATVQCLKAWLLGTALNVKTWGAVGTRSLRALAIGAH